MAAERIIGAPAPGGLRLSIRPAIALVLALAAFPVQAAAPAREAESPALSDGQVRALYDTYMMARQRTNEPTSGITYDALASTLRRQVPAVLGTEKFCHRRKYSTPSRSRV